MVTPAHDATHGWPVDLWYQPHDLVLSYPETRPSHSCLILPFLGHLAVWSLPQQSFIEYPVAHPRRWGGELLPGLQLFHLVWKVGSSMLALTLVMLVGMRGRWFHVGHDGCEEVAHGSLELSKRRRGGFGMLMMLTRTHGIDGGGRCGIHLVG